MDELCMCCDTTWYFMGGMIVGMISCGSMALIWWTSNADRKYRDERRKKLEKEEITPVRRRSI